MTQGSFCDRTEAQQAISLKDVEWDPPLQDPALKWEEQKGWQEARQPQGPQGKRWEEEKQDGCSAFQPSSQSFIKSR